MFAENKRRKKSKTLKMKRKVLFRKWIPIQYLKSENERKEMVEGTGVLQADYETYNVWCFAKAGLRRTNVELTTKDN